MRETWGRVRVVRFEIVVRREVLEWKCRMWRCVMRTKHGNAPKMTCSEPRFACITVPSTGWYAVVIVEDAFVSCRCRYEWYHDLSFSSSNNNGQSLMSPCFQWLAFSRGRRRGAAGRRHGGISVSRKASEFTLRATRAEQLASRAVLHRGGPDCYRAGVRRKRESIDEGSGFAVERVLAIH
jgi:hypothetical protein